jgi:hypothetical protein
MSQAQFYARGRKNNKRPFTGACWLLALLLLLLLLLACYLLHL